MVIKNCLLKGELKLYYEWDKFPHQIKIQIPSLKFQEPRPALQSLLEFVVWNFEFGTSKKQEFTPFSVYTGGKAKRKIIIEYQTVSAFSLVLRPVFIRILFPALLSE
jgi:hypothetical protein